VEYKGFTNVCLFPGVIPQDVDSNWYKTNFLFPIIDSVLLYNVIKTSTGKLMKISEVVIPNCAYENES